MGILNVTPDSFSDGGEFLSVGAAVDHALRLEDAGAAIIDIGGESTRPYSAPVDPATELERVVPVLEALQGRLGTPISIDTSKASVARAAMQLGAEIINDVTGLEGDPEMVEVALESGAGICAMHMRGRPQNMQDDPQYEDVVADIYSYLDARLRWLMERGIDRARICLDPGIGFGKTHEHNWELVRQGATFLRLGQPILVGHSRKGFIRKCAGETPGEIMAGTLGVSLALALQGIQVLRVHDVAMTRAALACFHCATLR
ncbi:MAG: dihydropteroate synthase [Planctomycetota bacterium]|nr:MAG: dihydropteroate synthase [Planctomycetota bacterium]